MQQQRLLVWLSTVMARRILARSEKIKLELSLMINVFNMMCMMCLALERHYRKYLLKNQPRDNRVRIRNDNLRRLICENDLATHENLRMDRHTFYKLCSMLRTSGKLKDSRHINVEKMVAMFLHILGHHEKNRVIKFRFVRSGETISRHFNAVLNAVLQLRGNLLKTPEPVLENSTDERWKWFKVYIIISEQLINCC